MDEATGIALNLLTNADCRKAVTGNAKGDPSSLLGFLTDAEAFDFNESNSAIASTPNPFDIATSNISLHPDFFEASPESRQYFTPAGKVRQLGSGAQGRALTILHELRHIYKNGNHPVGNRFPFDNELLKGCFGIDAGYPKGFGPSSTNIGTRRQ